MSAGSFWRALIIATIAVGLIVPAPIALGATATQVTWKLFHWGDPIQFSVSTTPVTTGTGILELLIDGDVYASFGYVPSQMTPTPPPPVFSVINNTTAGPHSVRVRWTPRINAYTPSVSTQVDLDDSLTPASGILVNGGRTTTNSLAVLIDASFDGTTGIDQVRLSNSSTTTGGLLDNGTTVAYAKHLPWTMSAGSDGTRTVWAQLHHDDGTGWSAPMSDDIYYDSTSPAGTFAINHGDPTMGDPWTNSIYEQSVDGSVSDASLAVGGSISHMGVSPDLVRWQVLPFTLDPAGFSWTDLNILDPAFGYPAVDGPKTVYVKWRDSAGNWSSPIDDSIDLVNSDSVGYVLIDDELTNSPNPAYRHTTNVEVTIHASHIPAEGLKSVRIGNDLDESPTVTRTWPDGASELVIASWSLTNASAGYTSADGIKNIEVELISNENRKLSTAARVLLDRSVPTSDSPAPGFALDTTVLEAPGGDGFGVSAQASVTTMSTDIQWKGQDRTGIKKYDLDRLLNGQWNDVALAQPTATSARQSVATGTSNQFRVQATDLAGNVGAWKQGATFSASVVQDSATQVKYSGTWRTDIRSDALGGTLRSTKVAGASAKITFTGRAFALVSPRTSSGPTATIYVDGNRIKDVQLSSGAYQAKRVVFSTSWKASGTHTVRIVKKYVNTRFFSIDALLILK